MVQQIIFSKELRNLIENQEFAARSSLKKLHTFIDKDGLLKVGGRLQQSTLPYQYMHQMILTANHHFTNLVVSAKHIRLKHAGPQLLIASLLEGCWFRRIRNFVKTVILQCLTCYKFKAQSTQQLMFELPSTLVQSSIHSSLKAWTILDQYHSDWDHHVAKPQQRVTLLLVYLSAS